MPPIASRRNISLVAFHGQTKPERLTQLLRHILQQIHTTIQDLGLSPTCFRPYILTQIHGTVLGLEVILHNGTLFNENFWKNNRQYQTIAPNPLLASWAAAIPSRSPLFTVRFGAFPAGRCTCGEPDLNTWHCPSSDSFHTYQRSAYEGSFYGNAPGAAMLTGWPVQDASTLDRFPRSLYQFRRRGESYGFLDRYHVARNPHWKNDDFYLRLGTFQPDAASQLPQLIERVRQYLSNFPPVTVEVKLQNLAIVYYDTPTFAQLRAKIPLAEAIQEPQRLADLYQQWSTDHQSD